MINNFDFLNLKNLTESQKQEIIQFMSVKGGKELLSNVDRKNLPLYKVALFLNRFPELKEYFIE